MKLWPSKVMAKDEPRADLTLFQIYFAGGRQLIGYTNQQIPAPKYWQQFEDLCADLFAKIWKDQKTQKNGRSGQKQHGVDVFGQMDGNGEWQGVQCKGKDAQYGGEVEEKELRDEVEKDKKFEPPIKNFILATTAATDAKIQKVARQITEENQQCPVRFLLLNKMLKNMKK